MYTPVTHITAYQRLAEKPNAKTNINVSITAHINRVVNKLDEEHSLVLTSVTRRR